MMHFKKNLLAEYKKHDSDETSTSSPPSSPTLSSSSSTALDRDDSKDSVSSGLQARYRVESVSSQPHLRASSNEQHGAVPLVKYKFVPGPLPKVQIQDLNHFENPKGKKKVHVVLLHDGASDSRSTTPDPPEASHRSSAMLSPSEGLTLELVKLNQSHKENLPKASSGFVEQRASSYLSRQPKIKRHQQTQDFNNTYQLSHGRGLLSSPYQHPHHLHHHPTHLSSHHHPHTPFTSFPSQNLPLIYDSSHHPFPINRHFTPIYNPPFSMQLSGLATSSIVETQVVEPHMRTLRLTNLRDLILEPCDEDSQPQSPQPRNEGATLQRFPAYSPTNSSNGSSSTVHSITSPSSAGMGPSPPPPNLPKERRRRKQDTLVPPDCPLKRDDIVDLPIDEFNDLIERGDFTEAQKVQFRDWRRKGKNRVAARKSREKRIISVEQLKAEKSMKKKQLGDISSQVARKQRENQNLYMALRMCEMKNRANRPPIDHLTSQ